MAKTKKKPEQVFSDRVYDILNGIKTTEAPIWSLDAINRAAAKLVKASRPVMPTEAEIEAWVNKLLAMANIRQSGPLLVNVPAKYVSIINCMHGALVELAAGQPLPEVTVRKRHS